MTTNDQTPPEIDKVYEVDIDVISKVRTKVKARNAEEAKKIALLRKSYLLLDEVQIVTSCKMTKGVIG